MATWAFMWFVAAIAGSDPCDPARTGIVLDEILANPPSVDTGLEWVEIHNGTAARIDLSGWMIASGTSDFGLSDPFPVGTALPAGAYLVVAAAPIPEADVVAPGFTLGNASSDADAVALVDCTGRIADTVVYGAPNDDGWLDDMGGIASSLAPAPPDGRTLGRDPDGIDTDRSGDDWVAQPYPTPGGPNDAPPETCGGPGSGLTVNEILPDPDGTDDDLEWVELYHAGREVLDLTGWSLEMGTSSASAKYTWIDGTIRPGDRLLLGGAGVPGADIVVDGLSLGNASSNADLVRIVDCLGFPADTVVYGSPNDDGFFDDAGEIASSLAPVAGSGASLQRISDGYDTDRCGADFAVTLSPTPGGPNVALAPVVCSASTGDVRLNEILPDPDGTDDGLEWIELYNGSDTERSVAGWSLSLATRAFDARDVVLGADLAIPPRGFLVIGGLDVAEVDVPTVLSLGNGTETDGIRLFDCRDVPVDTVLYGDAPNLDLVPDDRGQVVDPYGAPGSNEALARVSDGVDTDGGDDWKVVGIPTPGASNVRETGDIDDGFEGGCVGRPDGHPTRGPSEPSGGCRTTPGPPAPWPLVLVLIYLAMARWIVGVDGPR